MSDNNLAFRRHLRQESTPAEKILWQHLKSKQLFNFKFRRQHEIGPYIVDFYHNDSRTIIEVDGDIHFISDTNIFKDKVREDWLKGQGFMVLRYNNVDIMNNLDKILDEIIFNITSRLKAR